MSTYAEIPLTQGFVALVDEEDYERVVAAGKWQARRDRNKFYARKGGHRPDGSRVTIHLHAFLTAWGYVDHINGNGLDNRRANLREATNAENQRNRGRQRNNTSGFKGVSWDSKANGWRARIMLDGFERRLGTFPTPKDAAHAYDLAALELHGEFARLNFPCDLSERAST